MVGDPVAQQQIGAEIEVLVSDASTRLPASLDHSGPGSVLRLAREYARAHRGEETPGANNAPAFVLAGGGKLSFEPGGQLEFSTAPLRSGSALIRTIQEVLGELESRASDLGLSFCFSGIDPHTPLECAPLQLSSDRYRRMDAYFATRGRAGAMMMRQTAAFQVNLDWPQGDVTRWRVLNAAAPILVAVFANSPLYRGRVIGPRSIRAQCWRELDPRRTGLPWRAHEPAGRYVEFALEAPSFLIGDGTAGYRTFNEWLKDGSVTLADWEAHLTTLFPEVRPRGYLEVRSIDAIPPCWCAAPITLLAGLTYHGPTLQTAAELLGLPDESLLERATRQGLDDPVIARTAPELARLGLEGAEKLGGYFTDQDLAAAAGFFERFTLRNLAPADEVCASRTALIDA